MEIHCSDAEEDVGKKEAKIELMQMSIQKGALGV